MELSRNFTNGTLSGPPPSGYLQGNGRKRVGNRMEREFGGASVSDSDHRSMAQT